jgi:renalase
MNNSMIIVGAGMCGATIANRFLEQGMNVIVLEKSKGVGGRVATRRTENAKFDHGAQFYPLIESIQKYHDHWAEQELVHRWFERDGTACIVATEGLSSLAKDLLKKIDVRLEHAVNRIEKTHDGWKVNCENQPTIVAKNIVFTAPLPQSLEILKASGISFSNELSQITYTQALVGLFENSGPNDFGRHFLDYSDELGANGIYTISNQKSKGVSKIPSWTVTMNPQFSSEFYHENDATLLSKMLDSLRTLASNFQYTQFELKRWRYAAPIKTYSAPFLKIDEGLYLAGDSFGGPGIAGAIRSATGLEI